MASGSFPTVYHQSEEETKQTNKQSFQNVKNTNAQNLLKNFALFYYDWQKDKTIKSTFLFKFNELNYFNKIGIRKKPMKVRICFWKADILGVDSCET